MTTNDYMKSKSTTSTTSTTGPLFGWTATVDPSIKQPGADLPNTPAVYAKVVAVHDGSADVQMPDGSKKTIPVGTKAYQDQDAHGKPITLYRIVGNQGVSLDPQHQAGATRNVTDKDGHVYQEMVVSAPAKGAPPTENASQMMQEYALKAKSSNPQDRQQFLDLQGKLEGLGLLTKGKYLKGMPDDATQAALQAALIMAGRTGETLDEVLNDPTAIASAKIASKPPKLTNPDDVAANAQKTAFGVIGKPLDSGALGKIQGDAEAMAQQQYTNSDGQSTYYSSTPSEAWLQQEIANIMPQTAKAYGEFQGLGTIQNLLGTPSSPVGNLYHE